MSPIGNQRRFAHVPTKLQDLTTTVDHTPFHDDSRFEDFRQHPATPRFI